MSINKSIPLILVFTLGIAFSATAQRVRPKNMPKYDQKALHFGFCIGLNYYDFQYRTVADLAAVPEWRSVRSTVSPGYSIGIISNLRLGKYFDFRFIPTFTATERRLDFELFNKQTNTYDQEVRMIESSFIQLPFEIKFKSERINNHLWYVLGGVTYSIDLASKQDVEDDRIFKLKRNDLTYDVGIGLDLYFEYFKFSPQIKAGFGLANLKVEDGTLPVQGIDQIFTRSILINFTFE